MNKQINQCSYWLVAHMIYSERHLNWNLPTVLYKLNEQMNELKNKWTNKQTNEEKKKTKQTNDDTTFFVIANLALELHYFFQKCLPQNYRKNY